MTNKDVPDVLQWFKDFSDKEYARAGFVATKDVILPQGPLADFSHTIEPHLRRLGLPTSLERGVINLIKEYQVCVTDHLFQCYSRRSGVSTLGRGWLRKTEKNYVSKNIFI